MTSKKSAPTVRQPEQRNSTSISTGTPDQNQDQVIIIPVHNKRGDEGELRIAAEWYPRFVKEWPKYTLHKNNKTKNRELYVVRTVGNRLQYLHRWLLDAQPESKVGAKDGDFLNCTPANLFIKVRQIDPAAEVDPLYRAWLLERETRRGFRIIVSAIVSRPIGGDSLVDDVLSEAYFDIWKQLKRGRVQFASREHFFKWARDIVRAFAGRRAEHRGDVTTEFVDATLAKLLQRRKREEDDDWSWGKDRRAVRPSGAGPDFREEL